MADWKPKPAPGSEYDVFLNFRGEETRYNFTDFLYDRLVDAGVRAFMDEEKIRHGDFISDEIRHAINNSRLYIPIISPDYASSKWCLRELKLMVENVSSSGGQKSIIPIFLLVEPDDVKLKARPDREPLYKAAFEEHEKSYPKEVEAWKTALQKVGEHKGSVVEKKTRQAATVKSVVESVLKKLRRKQILATEHVIGLDEQIKYLTGLLDVNRDDVRLIVIYGMGGIGKTTCAKEVFNQLCFRFGNRYSFLEDVRNNCLTKEGKVKLQEKLLSDILDSKSAVADIYDGMRMIGQTLPAEKVFVILDDVDDEEHVKMLIGKSKLCPGSRIIITTRQKDVLKVGDFEGEIQWYDMPQMDYHNALQLFRWHAFGARDFPSNSYRQYSHEFVVSLGRHPFAVQVIGRLLQGKREEFWNETLNTLRESPEKHILDKLMISYDDLDHDQQQFFLDIACFLVNEKKTDAIYLWADPKVRPIRGIDALTNKCLIKILDEDKLWMHDLLIDLGRHIVRKESDGDLKRQSRLWIAEEALQIIRTGEMKDKVEALLIDGIKISNEELKRLPNLRFLKLRNGTFVGDFEQCCSKLKWISWHPPQQDFCEYNMHWDHLLVFKLDGNVFKDDSKAWGLSLMTLRFCGTSLVSLSLSECRGITTLDLTCPNLQVICLDGCDHLEKAHFCPVGLGSLNLGICPKLSELTIEAPKMVLLELKGCGVLEEASINCPLLTSLDASCCSQLRDDCLSATAKSCPLIESLILRSCLSVGSDGLYSLRWLPCLTILDLSYTFMTNLDPVFESCLHLKVLKLQACKYLTDSSLEPLYMRGALPSLQELDLSYGPFSQSAIGELLSCCTHLTHVSLDGCVNMHDLNWGCPGDLSRSPSASCVNESSESNNLLEPAELPNHLLQNLNCVGCPNIRKAFIPLLACCYQFSSLNLSLSSDLKEVDVACLNLCLLNLSNCCSLETLRLECPKLTSLFLQSCNLTEESLEAAVLRCTTLETLDVRYCPQISSVSMGRLRMVCPSLKRIYCSLSPP